MLGGALRRAVLPAGKQRVLLLARSLSALQKDNVPKAAYQTSVKDELVGLLLTRIKHRSHLVASFNPLQCSDIDK